MPYFTFNIDAGQILTFICISVIGFLIKRELHNITKMLDNHQELIISLIDAAGVLKGRVGVLENVNTLRLRNR